MIRNQLLETIQKALPIKLHIEYIALHLDMAFTDALPAIYKLYPAVLDQYCTTYEVDVTVNGSIYSCVIPKKILQFHLPGGGVRAVDPINDRKVRFAPATYDSIRIQAGLEVSALSDVIDYYPDMNRVIFGSKPGDNTKVNIRVMVAISDKDEDDDIYLPPGAISEIVRAVTVYAQATPPEKLANDQTEAAV